MDTFRLELIIPSITGGEDQRVKMGEAYVTPNQEVMVRALPLDEKVVEEMVKVQAWKTQAAS